MRDDIESCFKSGLRYMESFVAVFLVASVLQDFVTRGWAGIDLAAAWAGVGSLLPWLIGSWVATWAALMAGSAVWSQWRRPKPAIGQRKKQTQPDEW